MIGDQGNVDAMLKSLEIVFFRSTLDVHAIVLLYFHELEFFSARLSNAPFLSVLFLSPQLRQESLDHAKGFD